VHYQDPKQLARLAQELGDAGLWPDAIVFESDLVEAALRLMSEMSGGRVRSSHERFQQENQKLRCSLLTAAWYLLRLGLLDGGALICRATGMSLPPADRLINVLPDRYRRVEDNVDQVLLNTPYPAAIKRISRMYIRLAHGAGET
jgi:hypothetical protein